MSFDGATWSTRGIVSRPGYAVDVVSSSGAEVGMTATGQAVAV
jgi:hypothetical protein